jgi:hypothetical protein
VSESTNGMTPSMVAVLLLLERPEFVTRKGNGFFSRRNSVKAVGLRVVSNVMTEAMTRERSISLAVVP